jgi:hypothetical protein
MSAEKSQSEHETLKKKLMHITSRGLIKRDKAYILFCCQIKIERNDKIQKQSKTNEIKIKAIQYINILNLYTVDGD